MPEILCSFVVFFLTASQQVERTVFEYLLEENQASSYRSRKQLHSHLPPPLFFSEPAFLILLLSLSNLSCQHYTLRFQKRDSVWLLLPSTLFIQPEATAKSTETEPKISGSSDWKTLDQGISIDSEGHPVIATGKAFCAAVSKAFSEYV